VDVYDTNRRFGRGTIVKGAAVMALAVAGLLILFGSGVLPTPATMTAKVPRIGLLGLDNGPGLQLDLLRLGMLELGYVEGHDYTIEARWAGGGGGDNLERGLRVGAEELARLPVDVIVASGPGVRHAHDVTTTIPIVMAGQRDPVGRRPSWPGTRRCAPQARWGCSSSRWTCVSPMTRLVFTVTWLLWTRF
jgi:hypothetical protein